MTDHLARGRAEFDRVRAAGGDVMAAALAWINTSFDEQARADMLREGREEMRLIITADQRDLEFAFRAARFAASRVWSECVISYQKEGGPDFYVKRNKKSISIRADILRKREIARLEAGIYEQHDFVK